MCRGSKFCRRGFLRFYGLCPLRRRKISGSSRPTELCQLQRWAVSDKLRRVGVLKLHRVLCGILPSRQCSDELQRLR